METVKLTDEQSQRARDAVKIAWQMRADLPDTCAFNDLWDEIREFMAEAKANGQKLFAWISDADLEILAEMVDEAAIDAGLPTLYRIEEENV